MYPQRYDLTITTSTASGSDTNYVQIATGRVLSVQYASTTLETTGSYAVTNERTEEAIFTHAPAASTPTYYPRKAICDSTGGSIMHTTGGDAVTDYFFLFNDRVKLVATNVGASVTATFRVTIG